MLSAEFKRPDHCHDFPISHWMHRAKYAGKLWYGDITYPLPVKG